MGNEISQLRRLTVEFSEHCRNRPDEHSRIPPEISLPQKRLNQIEARFFAKAQDPVNRIVVGTLAQTYRLPLLYVSQSTTCPSWFSAACSELPLLPRGL